MRRWNEYWFGPVVAARPYLLIKSFLYVLAFDIWSQMIEHGGRYGVGGFNVAHFALLDALQPVPTAAFYVGTIALCGLLTFAVAFAGTDRTLLGVAALLYSYSWMMSMIDGYQHHYMLSLLLVCFVFFPRQNADVVFGRVEYSRSNAELVEFRSSEPPDSQSPWAYYLIAATCAVVYGYTALSKTDPAWLSGDALRVIAPGRMVPLQALAIERLAVTGDLFWWIAGHSVVVVQIVIAVGYAMSPMIDRNGVWARVVGAGAFIAAWSFHWGAEWLGLQIGWFSYYMLIASAVFFLPGRVVYWIGGTLSWPARASAAVVRELDERAGGKVSAVGVDYAARPLVLAPLLLISSAIALAVAYRADIPGLAAAVAVATALLFGRSVRLLWWSRPVEGRVWIASVGLASLAMWSAIVVSDVRWEYYRRIGGVYRRHALGAVEMGDRSLARENFERSLRAYSKATTFAPQRGACTSDTDCDAGLHCAERQCTGDRSQRMNEIRERLRTLQ